MKKYVSGKIAGLAEADYREAFARACALVMSEGDTPVNPLEVQACETEDCQPYGTSAERLANGQYLHTWACYLKYDIIAMLDCGGIVMVPNWKTSKGANFELDVAEKCGLKVEYITPDYKTIWSHV